MKKVLIGTTALVALAATASTATARDVELNLGGFLNAGVAAFDADDDEQPFVVLRQGEVFFGGSGTLDNGLSIDARVELEAMSSEDNIDENWVRVNSQFGQILLGGNDDAAYNIGYVGFTDTFINHASSDGTYGFTPAGTLGTIGGSDDISIQYYTPTIAGLQAGISYQPDDSSDGGSDGSSTSTADADTGPFSDKVAIGLGYDNSFGEIDFTVAGQYIFAEEGLEQYGIGASVGFSGISLNGRWDTSDSDLGEEQMGYTFGANYSTGPWTFGAGYGFREGEGAAGDDAQLISVGANYSLGDGVTVGGGVEWGDDGDEDGVAGALLLGVSF